MDDYGYFNINVEGSQESLESSLEYNTEDPREEFAKSLEGCLAKTRQNNAYGSLAGCIVKTKNLKTSGGMN